MKILTKYITMISPDENLVIVLQKNRFTRRTRYIFAMFAEDDGPIWRLDAHRMEDLAGGYREGSSRLETISLIENCGGVIRPV